LGVKLYFDWTTTLQHDIVVCYIIV